MSDEERQFRETIVKFLKNSSPIHWVDWVGRCSDLAVKKRLNAVLFDGNSLRDLTNADVRAEILEAIYQTPEVMEILILDLAAEIAKYTGETLPLTEAP